MAHLSKEREHRPLRSDKAGRTRQQRCACEKGVGLEREAPAGQHAKASPKVDVRQKSESACNGCQLSPPLCWCLLREPATAARRAAMLHAPGLDHEGWANTRE